MGADDGDASVVPGDEVPSPPTCIERPLRLRGALDIAGADQWAAVLLGGAVVTEVVTGGASMGRNEVSMSAGSGISSTSSTSRYTRLVDRVGPGGGRTHEGTRSKSTPMTG